MEFEKVVSKARESFKSKSIIGKNPAPRFESYHAPFSICSEKVRCVLLIKNVDFAAHNVVLRSQENYRPEYVALRALGMGREDRELVGGHAWTGSTSSQEMGFDPLALPTLVDNLKKRVIVDSMQIMEYVDQEIPNPPLYPETCKEMVEKHMELVDRTPHAGLLYGGDPDNDTRPGFVKAFANGLCERQCKTLKFWLNNKNLPEELRHLYEAKLKKFQSVSHTLTNDQHLLRSSIRGTKDILAELNKDLMKSGGPWICGNHFTMADIAWHVSLLRFLTFGCGYLWEDLPQVQSYLSHVLSHPVLKSATYTWPGYIPSPHLTSLLYQEAGMILSERNRLMVVMMSFLEGGVFMGLPELVKYAGRGSVGMLLAVMIGMMVWATG
eukprot:GFUD01018661.1.p1 GENE.GFUD01018661.1~~GFUD01018661.1.p1  ORF type:complete len:402 (-),score=99.65 GFUD01018661.1:1627-2772(-)